MSRTGALAAAAGALLTVDVSKTIEGYESELRKARDQADQLVVKMTQEDRELTTDEQSALAEAQGKVASYTKRIEALRKQSKIHEETTRPGESRTRGKDTPAPGDSDDAKEARAAHRAAMDRYIRFGMQALDEEQRSLLMGHSVNLQSSPETRDLSALTGSAAGFTVADEMIREIEIAMKSFSGVAQSRSRLFPTSTGADLPWPTANDTNNTGELVAENVATTIAAAGAGDPTFGQVVFKSYLFSSKLIKVPIQLLQDSATNIEELMGRMLGERLGRITNTKYTVGTGANEPQGIVTGATLGNTAAATAAITYGEMIDLQHTVDPAYRPDAQFMFHDTTWSILRKLLDSNGRPIWQPAAGGSMGAAAEGTLLGQGFVVNQDMAVPAASAKVILYGDLSKYVRRQVKGYTLIRLAERFAEQFQVGFVAFLRSDGRLLDAGTHPIKYLQQHA